MEEQASRFIVFLRWIVFLPIGFVLGTVASAILLRAVLFCAILFGSHLSEIAASFWWRAFWLPLTNGVYGVAWVHVSTSLAPTHKIGAAYRCRRVVFSTAHMVDYQFPDWWPIQL